MLGGAAVVTGAGGGIGRATALALAADGLAVVCADADGDAADATAAAVSAGGGSARGQELDVTRWHDVEAVAADVAASGERLRAWVNVAGIMRYAKVLDLGEDELDAVMAVNFKGAVAGSRAAAGVMLAAGEGGSIVNVVSAIIDGPQARMAAYGASKAALSHFSRTLALEVGKHGVRVNLVAPGWTRTAMTEAQFRADDGTLDEAATDQMASMNAQFTPLRRAAIPEDTASSVAWLVSDAAAFMTGQTLRPHGGITLPW